MDEKSESSSLGPVLFFGLCALAVVTQGAPEIDSNPKRSMPIDAFSGQENTHQTQQIDVLNTSLLPAKANAILANFETDKLLTPKLETIPNPPSRTVPRPIYTATIASLNTVRLDIQTTILALFDTPPDRVTLQPNFTSLSVDPQWMQPKRDVTRVFVNGDRVRLRADPDFDAQVIAYHNLGETAVILDDSGKWLLLEIGAEQGWMHSDYVSVR